MALESCYIENQGLILHKMNIRDYIAGQYQQQYEYKSFSPEKINHAWEFSDGKVLQLLSDADRVLGELNAFSQLVSDVDFLFVCTLLKRQPSPAGLKVRTPIWKKRYWMKGSNLFNNPLSEDYYPEVSGAAQSFPHFHLSRFCESFALMWVVYGI